MSISTWSFSRLSIYEQCPYRAKLAFVDKIPEPPRVLKPGQTEFANDRGTRVHEAAEFYVRGEAELIPELEAFSAELKELRKQYKAGKVSLEGEWGFDKDWTPVAWNSSDVWARVKLDALYFKSKTHAVVIDYKTGKKVGNEIKHAEQTQLYQLATFIRYPEIMNIDVELWYLDKDDTSHMSFTRDQGLRFFKRFNDAGVKMTCAENFPKNRNKFSCRWCPYGPKGTGDCPDGVQ
jgi:CRISPR/Cas system-associated exonuclease Cas4 (RecB family)